MEQTLAQPSRVSSSENPQAAAALAQDLFSTGPLLPPNGIEPDEENPNLISRPPECQVSLPGGLVTVEGDLVQDAEVRELTGADEEALAKADIAKSPGRFVAVLLKRGVARLGDEEPPSPTTLDALLIGDRDTLILAIRRATYGDTLDFSTRCMFCMEGLDMEIDLANEVPIKPMEDPAKRQFEVELRRGRVAVVELPVGADQIHVLAMVNKTVPEMNTMMISRCLKSLDGMPMMGLEAARSLGMADRQTILDFLGENQPGPKYEEVKAQCPACERDVPLRIDLADLFRG